MLLLRLAVYLLRITSMVLIRLSVLSVFLIKINRIACIQILPVTALL